MANGNGTGITYKAVFSVLIVILLGIISFSAKDVYSRVDNVESDVRTIQMKQVSIEKDIEYIMIGVDKMNETLDEINE